VTKVASTPLIAEKPYIVMSESDGKFQLIVPGYETNKTGHSADWALLNTTVTKDFDGVYVAN